MSTAIIYEGRPGTRVQTPVATIVGAEHAHVTQTAQELVAAGAERVELCGALGPIPHAAVQDALGDSARVGAVMYGFESFEGIADFKRRFAAGERLTGAFLYHDPAADPAGDRREHDGTTFVAIPDEQAAGAVAAELAAQGVALFELYGGLGPAAAAAVVAATDGRIPVGVALYQP